MKIIIIAACFLLLTKLCTSCISYHRPISGSLDNRTSEQTDNYRWVGYIDCRGRKLLDINPFYDIGNKGCGEKDFNIVINPDGSFKLPSARFITTLRSRTIQYYCKLVDHNNVVIGSLNVRDKNIKSTLYNQPIVIQSDLRYIESQTPFPTNILMVVKLSEPHINNEQELIFPLQQFLESQGLMTFEEKRLASLFDQADREAFVSITIRDQEGKWRVLTIVPVDTPKMNVEYKQGAALTISFSSAILIKALKEWAHEVETGEAWMWHSKDEYVKNPPPYLSQFFDAANTLTLE